MAACLFSDKCSVVCASGKRMDAASSAGDSSRKLCARVTQPCRTSHRLHAHVLGSLARHVIGARVHFSVAAMKDRLLRPSSITQMGDRAKPKACYRVPPRRSVLALLHSLGIVIDRKRIFLFRPKTNIRQENAAEYSADNKYSAQGSKHYKKVKFA
jgi:hypothetical protein